jgi:2-deoxy-D-gluconate 3-dehydrogenase
VRPASLGDDPFDVSGKAAIVTGATRGIGLGVARRFVALGMDVVLAGRDEAALRDASAALAQGPGRTVAMRVDVTADRAGPSMVGRCVEAFGRLDVLVNVAGLFRQVPVLETAPELFDLMYEVNLRAVALASQAAARRFIEQGGGGKIVNVASIDALHPSLPGLCAYDASKGGVLTFTRSFALEMAPHGVLVNAIAPGPIATDGAAAGIAEERRAEAGAWIRARVPLGRMGTPDDVAKVAVFLASPASDFMTGAVVVVDGGTLVG